MATGSSSDASTVAHQGGMIALMPTTEDAARLVIKGGEPAPELHCTLMFLGGDATVFDDAARQEIIGAVQMLAAYLPPVTSKIFGIAHWNAGGDSPAWVWSVGDGPEGPCLEEAHGLAQECIWMCQGSPVIPEQHTPWVAHICAAYTDDLTFAKDLEKRLGPVTFDRIRVSFGDEDTDIPLNGSMTASGEMRRVLTSMEIASRADFAMIDTQWRSAVADMMRDYIKIEDDQRAELRAQIIAAVDKGDFGVLDTLHVSWAETARLLQTRMTSYAELAGKEMQHEAEAQGVKIPPWDLTSELVAGSARDIIGSVARATARNLGLGMIQSAARKAMSFVGSKRSGRDVANEVDQDLKLRSPAGPREQIGAAMTAAQNAGRLSVLSVAPEAVYLASESLDKNTCPACKTIDGTEFSSLSAAHEAYPGGGYIDCAGGGRCRGTMIAVWNRGETASATQEVGMATETEVLGGPPNPGTKPDKRKKDNKAMAAQDCPEGQMPGPDGKCMDKTDMSSSGSDVKADITSAAPGLEGITLTEDGRILDADGNEIESLSAVTAADQQCPPGMEYDPGTGECAAPKSSSGKTAAWRGVLVVE